jgi:hypothetical protein
MDSFTCREMSRKYRGSFAVVLWKNEPLPVKVIELRSQDNLEALAFLLTDKTEFRTENPKFLDIPTKCVFDFGGHTYYYGRKLTRTFLLGVTNETHFLVDLIGNVFFQRKKSLPFDIKTFTTLCKQIYTESLENSILDIEQTQKLSKCISKTHWVVKTDLKKGKEYIVFRHKTPIFYFSPVLEKATPVSSDSLQETLDFLKGQIFSFGKVDVC